MTPYVVFDRLPGPQRIKRRGVAVSPATVELLEGEAMLPVEVDGDTHCIADGAAEIPVLAQRPAPPALSKKIIIANGLDEAVLTPAPEGTRVHVDGSMEGVVGNNGFGFRAADAGSYRLRFETPFPMQVLEVTVVAKTVIDEAARNPNQKISRVVASRKDTR